MEDRISQYWFQGFVQAISVSALCHRGYVEVNNVVEIHIGGGVAKDLT